MTVAQLMKTLSFAFASNESPDVAKIASIAASSLTTVMATSLSSVTRLSDVVASPPVIAAVSRAASGRVS